MILDKFFKRKPQITLSPRTAKLIEDLHAVEWFANVGRPVQGSERVVFVKDWDAAIAESTSETFDNATVEALNILTLYYKKRYVSDWNEMIRVIRPNVISLWEEKLSSAKEKGICPAMLSSKAYGNLLLAVAYVECSDLPKLEYFDEVLHWYLAGHFPCGWLGDVPEDFEHSFQFGKLMVF